MIQEVRLPNRAAGARTRNRTIGSPFPASTGGDHSHETGFDCELGDNLHLADAESQKGAYLMDA